MDIRDWASQTPYRFITVRMSAQEAADVLDAMKQSRLQDTTRLDSAAFFALMTLLHGLDRLPAASRQP